MLTSMENEDVLFIKEFRKVPSVSFFLPDPEHYESIAGPSCMCVYVILLFIYYYLISCSYDIYVQNELCPSNSLLVSMQIINR